MLDSKFSENVEPDFYFKGTYLLSTSSPNLKLRLVDQDLGADEKSESDRFELPKNASVIKVSQKAIKKHWYSSDLTATKVSLIQ